MEFYVFQFSHVGGQCQPRMHGHRHGYRFDIATRAIFEKLYHETGSTTPVWHGYDIGTAL